MCGLGFYDDGDGVKIEPRLMSKTLTGLTVALKARTESGVVGRQSDFRLQTV